MKPIVVISCVLCLFLIGVAVFLGTHDSGSSRLVNLDAQYSQRKIDGYWKRGATNSVTTLEVYSDFQCEACANEYPIIEAGIQEMGGAVQLRFRQFPVTNNATSVLAAEAAESAGRQGKFWLMYQRLYSTR